MAARGGELRAVRQRLVERRIPQQDDLRLGRHAPGAEGLHGLRPGGYRFTGRPGPEPSQQALPMRGVPALIGLPQPGRGGLQARCLRQHGELSLHRLPGLLGPAG